MGWYIKLRERKLGGGGEAEYDLKAGSTSWLHPIMVAFSPLQKVEFDRPGERSPE